MRQNSTNIFNKGLNYDLNPITTPNDILTDCVNGTFITFNGDELALQNDAGNTKIAVPGSSPTEYVELTPDFYPLGMKEYGGVLYIVSAKTPDESTWAEWSAGTWPLGAVVYQTVLDDVVFYTSLTDNNTSTLDSGNWEELGSQSDAINKLSEVEFGSYPSPEGADVRTFLGTGRKYDSSIDGLSEEAIVIKEANFDNLLYKKLVINDAIFKSSRYIVFDGEESNEIDVERASGHSVEGTQVTYSDLFWRMKLFHYLSNGYFDLTSDIEDKYATYLENNYTGDGLRHWFSDNSFRYYCPTQFKGQLAMSLEIEPLTTFQLHGYPGFSTDGTVYRFELNITAEGTGLIDITEARVEIWIGGIPYDLGSGLFYEDITITDGKGKFVLTTIPSDTIDDEIVYRITPIIEVETVTYAEGKYPDAYEDLPQQYVDQFVINGSRLIGTLYDDVVFEEDATAECLDGFPYKEYKIFTLKNGGGDLLDLTLAANAVPHLFVRQDLWDANYDVNNSVVTIATFDTYLPTDINYFPKDVDIKQPTVYDAIMTMFKKVHVAEYSEECDSSLVFDATFVGVTQEAGIQLLNETGDYKFINIPGITRPQNDIDFVGQSVIPVEMIRNCVQYDADDKLVFVGEADGYLTIVDISDPFTPLSKKISVASDKVDICTVKIIAVKDTITNVTTKTIYIGTRNGKVFRQPYYSLYTDYMSGVASPMATPSGVKYIRDFEHYSGYIYAIGKEYEFLRMKTDDLLHNLWEEFSDIHDQGYKVLVGQQNIWWVGYYSNQKNSERITVFNRATPADNGVEAFNLSHPTINNQQLTDITLLSGDDLLLYDLRGGQGVWRTTGQSGDTDYITRYLWADYDKVDEDLYVGGGCFDGSEYAYVSTKKNTTYKIRKYQAYGDGPMWTDIDAVGFYHKLFLY